RSKIMEGLPTAGLPHQMRNWSEYVWLINHLVSTGFINSIREIWWDVRPHHNFGTVEVRVCDMPPNLDQVLAIAALVQCLVRSISAEIDEGTYQSEYHPMMVQQNKWRAIRFGADARLVSTKDFQPRTVQSVTDGLIRDLQPIASELSCSAELEFLRTMPESNGAHRQLQVFAESGSRREVVRTMLNVNHWSNSQLLQ
ncbi:MAG: glutamate--cysteine ligase, partial [Planctomycetaceae bacterium]|nr:glutamate--cysteine ligase [Planctomycetaceae bacterium]